MTRPFLALLMGIIVVLSGVDAQDEPTKADDPVAAELAMAKETYQKAVKAAGEKLVAAFEAEDKKAEKNTKLSAEQYSKLSKQLAEERKAFETDPSKLPKSPVTQDAVKGYQQAMSSAKTKCETAFSKAAEAYRGKDKAALDAVLTEKQQFFKGGPLMTVPKGNMPAPGKDGWVQLFNGKDLAGWQNGGNLRAVWKVDGGVLVGHTPAPATVLVSTKTDYKNFHFRITTMLSEGANSSQNFRNYRVFIGGTIPAEFGKTGELHKGGDILVKAPGVMLKPGEWFTQEVIAKGNRISVLVNGKSVVEYEEKAGPPVAGRFELMCRGDSTVRFKKIEVKEMPDE